MIPPLTGVPVSVPLSVHRRGAWLLALSWHARDLYERLTPIDIPCSHCGAGQGEQCAGRPRMTADAWNGVVVHRARAIPWTGIGYAPDYEYDRSRIVRAVMDGDRVEIERLAGGALSCSAFLLGRRSTVVSAMRAAGAADEPPAVSEVARWRAHVHGMTGRARTIDEAFSASLQWLVESVKP